MTEQPGYYAMSIAATDADGDPATVEVWSEFTGGDGDGLFLAIKAGEVYTMALADLAQWDAIIEQMTAARGVWLAANPASAPQQLPRRQP